MNIQKPTTSDRRSEPDSTPLASPPARSIVLWVLQILVAATFLTTGMMKLLGHPMPVELFEKLGVGQWLRYVTGLIEISGGLLILFPRWASLAAGLLAGTMLGAIASHLTKVGGSPLPAVVLFFLCLVIAWGRRDRLFGRSLEAKN